METFGKNNNSAIKANKVNDSFELMKKKERVEQITNKYINQSKPQYRPQFDHQSNSKTRYDSKSRYDSKTRNSIER